MLLYNLFLYFSVRDPAYLSYVFYYTCFLMFQLSMTGLSFQYLWPDSAWWARKSLPVFGLLS